MTEKGEKRTEKKSAEAIIAEAIIEYCLSTFDTADTKIASDRRQKDITDRQYKILKIYEDEALLAKKKGLFKSKIFNDSIHKTIELNPVEIAVIQTPEFFRLKSIKQLGGACHVYPGAVHTRFDHSLGVCHLAGEFVKTLRDNCKKCDGEDVISAKEEMCIRLAGLCHDLGHGPFSHLFEGVKRNVLSGVSLKEWKEAEAKKAKEMEAKEIASAPGEKSSKFQESEKPIIFLEHEQISVLVLKWILVQYPDVLITFVEHGLTEVHVEMIANMIDPDEEYKKSSPKQFLYEIVANKESGLDVDKWDYFARDCHYLGLTNEFDYRRTMKLSTIVHSGNSEKHIGFKEKEIQNIFHMFRTRSILHQKAYGHQVSTGIEMMISDILREVKDKEIFQDGDHLKQSLVNILEKSVLHEVPYRDLTGFIRLTDGVLDIINNENMAQKLLKRIMQRELYWCENEETTDTKGTAELMKTFEQKYGGDEYETKKIKISYSSEEGPNPVKKVYFYKEEGHLPKGEHIETETLKKLLSRINIPEVYLEYRVRAYCKTPKHPAKKMMLEV